MYEVENRAPNFDLYPVKTMNDIKANVGVDEIVKQLKTKSIKIIILFVLIIIMELMRKSLKI